MERPVPRFNVLKSSTPPAADQCVSKRSRPRAQTNKFVEWCRRTCGHMFSVPVRSHVSPTHTPPTTSHLFRRPPSRDTRHPESDIQSLPSNFGSWRLEQFVVNSTLFHKYSNNGDTRTRNSSRWGGVFSPTMDLRTLRIFLRCSDYGGYDLVLWSYLFLVSHRFFPGFWKCRI